MFKADYRRVGVFRLDSREHSHGDVYEMIHTLSDGGTVLIGDRVYPMVNGGLYIFDAMNVHATNPDDRNSYTRSKISVDRRWMETLLSLMGLESALSESGGVFIRLNAGDCAAVDGAFRACRDAAGSRAEMAVFTEAAARILGYLMRKQPEESRENQPLQRILDSIRAHLFEPLTVAQIAAESFVSPCYVCHIFREKTGMTVMQYIKARRLAAAEEQLLRSDASITEIALACGFEDASYFARVFRSTHGVTPREYRKRCRREGPEK